MSGLTPLLGFVEISISCYEDVRANAPCGIRKIANFFKDVRANIDLQLRRLFLVFTKRKGQHPDILVATAKG